MHAQVYTDKTNVESYLVSEKLNGVRARWDGKRLISRLIILLNMESDIAVCSIDIKMLIITTNH